MLKYLQTYLLCSFLCRHYPPRASPMNTTDYTASPAILCTDLTDQTSQERAPSFIYPVPSLTTSYSIHLMIPLNLHGAMSLPTKSPSPSAVSIDHLTAPTTSLYKHSSNVFVELNSTSTTPSLLGTLTLKITHGWQLTKQMLLETKCGTCSDYMASSNWSTSQLTYTEAPPPPPFHALTYWPPILTAPQSQSPVQPPLEDRTIYPSLCTSPAHHNHILRGLTVQRDTHWIWHPNNILSLRHGLANADLVGHLPTDAPDSNQVTELWTHWRNTVIQIGKVHCWPPRTKDSTNRNPGPSRPWITQELLSAIKDKHKR